MRLSSARTIIEERLAGYKVVEPAICKQSGSEATTASTRTVQLPTRTGKRDGYRRALVRAAEVVENRAHRHRVRGREHSAEEQMNGNGKLHVHTSLCKTQHMSSAFLQRGEEREGVGRSVNDCVRAAK
jgi:hypothetical protein